MFYPQLPPAPPKPPRQWDGSKVLAWVGGAVTLFGVVLLLVLAVQRGWLGPLPRVLCGAGFGGLLIGSGLWVHRTPAGRGGAFALAATGIAVLYLDVVAATSLYDFLPQWAGLLVGLVVAAGGLLLAAKWNSQVLASFVVLGCAICDPILTHGFTPLLVSFLLVLQIGATPVHLIRTWPGLALAAGAPPLLAAMIAVGVAFSHRAEVEGTAGVALAAMLIGVASAVITVRQRRTDPVPVLLLATAPVTALLAAIPLERYEAAGLAAIVAVVMLAVALSDRWLSRGVTMAATFTAAIALMQATATALDGANRPIAILGEAVVLAVVAGVLKRREMLLGAGLAALVGLFLSFSVVPPQLLIYGYPFVSSASSALASVLILALAVAMPWAAARGELFGSVIEEPVPWVISGIVGLYGAAGTVICCSLLISPDRTGFLFGHAVVTVSWTVVALTLLLRGIESTALRATGLVLVGAAVVKLVLFDLAALDGIARVAAFLVAGLLLLVAGTRYARLVSGREVITDESQGVTNRAQD